MGREREAAKQGGRHAGRWGWGTSRPRVPPDAHREARLATRQLPPMGSWPGDLSLTTPLPTIGCPGPPPGGGLGAATPQVHASLHPSWRRPGENRSGSSGLSRRGAQAAVGRRRKCDGLGAGVGSEQAPPPGLSSSLLRSQSPGERAAGAHSTPPPALSNPGEDQTTRGSGECWSLCSSPSRPSSPPHHAFPTQTPISILQTLDHHLPPSHQDLLWGGCRAQLCRLCTAQGQTHPRRRHLHPRRVCL